MWNCRPEHCPACLATLHSRGFKKIQPTVMRRFVSLMASVLTFLRSTLPSSARGSCAPPENPSQMAMHGKCAFSNVAQQWGRQRSKKFNCQHSSCSSSAVINGQCTTWCQAHLWRQVQVLVACTNSRRRADGCHQFCQLQSMGRAWPCRPARDVRKLWEASLP